MSDTENISEIFTRFTNIVNRLRALWQGYSQNRVSQQDFTFSSRKLGTEGNSTIRRKMFNYCETLTTQWIIDHS